jgi:hypothetical protein
MDPPLCGMAFISHNEISEIDPHVTARTHIPVWLKISDVSPSLKLLRLGVYWTERLRHYFQTEERL